MLLPLGNNKKCTPTFVSEFAKVYSLPTSDYKIYNDDFKRYPTWLENRNNLCDAFVGIKSYLKDGPAIIENLMTSLRNHKYKQTRLIKFIWNGSHMILSILKAFFVSYSELKRKMLL